MLKKYLEDDNKNPSSMRLMSFTSLWMSFPFAIAAVFDLPFEDKTATEESMWIFIFYLGGGLSGKTAQKLIEKLIEKWAPKIEANPKLLTEQREDNEEKKS